MSRGSSALRKKTRQYKEVDITKVLSKGINKDNYNQKKNIQENILDDYKYHSIKTENDLLKLLCPNFNITYYKKFIKRSRKKRFITSIYQFKEIVECDKECNKYCKHHNRLVSTLLEWTKDDRKEILKKFDITIEVEDTLEDTLKKYDIIK